jgi:hypothetical protein
MKELEMFQTYVATRLRELRAYKQIIAAEPEVGKFSSSTRNFLRAPASRFWSPVSRPTIREPPNKSAVQ